jgi:hypothetical protein
MRIGLIKLARDERKICGSEVMYELADLFSKCGLTWTRTVVFVSDWDMAVISHSMCCSRVKQDRILDKTSFRRLLFIIYVEALCAKSVKVTGWMDNC